MPDLQAVFGAAFYFEAVPRLDDDVDRRSRRQVADLGRRATD